VNHRRPPDDNDLRALAELLFRHRVEYVVIGGGAMALHGFPRGTKDIDLFLPVDHDNNERLLAALRELPQTGNSAHEIKLEWLDKGFSTAAEGELVIDLLFVAAGKTFDELRSHIRTVDLDGVPVTTLDVDGMLITKKTTRESDIADRAKLQRLINARNQGQS